MACEAVMGWDAMPRNGRQNGMRWMGCDADADVDVDVGCNVMCCFMRCEHVVHIPSSFELGWLLGLITCAIIVFGLLIAQYVHIYDGVMPQHVTAVFPVFRYARNDNMHHAQAAMERC